MTTKLQYFKLAVDANNHMVLDWVISIFSLTQGDSLAQYPYKLSNDQLGYYYTDPEGNKVKIGDGVAGQALYTAREVIQLTAGMVPNLKTDVDTSYGEWLANLILLVYPFGDKIDYINQGFGIPEIEERILASFYDDLPEGQAIRTRNAFFVSEYKKFSRAVFFLTGFTQLFVWAATKKNMLPPEGLKEFKAALIKKYEGKLHDAVEISNMEKELIEFDRQWRGDDEGNNFLISKKSVNMTRKRKLLVYGAETGADGNANRLNLVSNSLYEGWDMKQFPAMCTTQRLGSYSRGAETMLGGVEVKWLLRASSNINVTEDDCGSKLGVPRVITQADTKSLVGFKIITGQTSTLLETPEAVGQYLGKLVMVRSPMYCKLGHTDYCKACVGKRLSDTPYALSSAVSAYGSAFLMISLAAAHSKGIETAKLDLATDLN